MTYRVTEIFRSIQGEGPHVGSQAIFVRFSGCNLSCPFCDTDHSTSVLMTADSILETTRYLCHANPRTTLITNRTPVVFTGGEPLLQLDLPLVNLLAPVHPLHLETNGSVSPVVDGLLNTFAAVVVSPKAGAEYSQPVLDAMTCLKLLVPFQIPNVEDLLRFVNGGRAIVLQPITPSPFDQNVFEQHCKEAAQKAEELSAAYPNVRVIPQVHRWMNLR